MPAYRSTAEAEVRDAVVARLRERRPEARIIHEINVSGQGSNRIDVLAVSPAEIIAVEVKSAKDKLDRLPKQIAAMRLCAHHVIAALHERHLVAPEWSHVPGTVVAPGAARGAEVWAYPERGAEAGRSYDCAAWQHPHLRLNAVAPVGAIDLLWRDELAWLCGSLGVASGRRSTMTDMVSALRWHCTGRELTKGICSALRTRQCVEADPPIEVAA